MGVNIGRLQGGIRKVLSGNALRRFARSGRNDSRLINGKTGELRRLFRALTQARRSLKSPLTGVYCVPACRAA